jgi:integrase
LPPSAVTVDHMLTILKPIWSSKPETASRVRGRIEAVLSAAKVRGFRIGENPAAWKDNLALLLPARSRVTKVRHHPALPWQQIPAIMTTLGAKPGEAARALRFAILTAARSGEVRGLRWREIDLAEKTWTVRAERMKAGRPHRVPLSDAAMAVVAEAAVAHGFRLGRDLVPCARWPAVERHGVDAITAWHRLEGPNWRDDHGARHEILVPRLGRRDGRACGSCRGRVGPHCW